MTLLLATDLDGTILFDRRVGRADRDALRRWRRAGHLLVASTGKSVFATRDTLGPEEVEVDYAVTFTGAVLTDGGYEVLRARFLPEGLARAVVDHLEGVEGLTVFATTIRTDHIVSDTYREVSPILQVFEPLEPGAMDGHRFIGVPMRVRDDEVRERIVAELTERWGGLIEVVRNQEFLDVVPAGATKGAGLTELIGLLTAPGGPAAGQRLETWTIGDSWNDLSMHAVADHAVALPWSPPEVREACDQVVGSVAELVDGILGARPPGADGALA